MNEWLIVLAWAGIYITLAGGAIGSTIGCTIAGQAAIGAMMESEGGYGRYVGVSVMPSSQVIYGIVVMFTLNRPITPETAPGIFMLGVLSGIAFLYIGIKQGQCCAAAIHAFQGKPEIFGMSVAPAAIVEGFSVFVFVFTLVLSAGIPQG